MKPYLTGQQVLMLKKSFRQLNTERLAKQFYNKLFERHPEVKPMFPTDTVELGAKLMSVFELVVFSFDEKSNNQFGLQDVVLNPLRTLGRKHDDKGVKPVHYEIGCDLLLQTMREEGGEQFTPEILQSWQLALEHLTEAMLNTAVKPTDQTEKEFGDTLRDTFTYIIKKLQGQPG